MPFVRGSHTLLWCWAKTCLCYQTLGLSLPPPFGPITTPASISDSRQEFVDSSCVHGPLVGVGNTVTCSSCIPMNFPRKSRLPVKCLVDQLNACSKLLIPEQDRIPYLWSNRGLSSKPPGCLQAEFWGQVAVASYISGDGGPSALSETWAVSLTSLGPPAEARAVTALSWEVIACNLPCHSPSP